MTQQTLDSGMRTQRIEYIERMAFELARMAADQQLPMLAYILDMAVEEAAISKGAPPMAAIPLPPRPGRTPRRLGDGRPAAG